MPHHYDSPALHNARLRVTLLLPAACFGSHFTARHPISRPGTCNSRRIAGMEKPEGSSTHGVTHDDRLPSQNHPGPVQGLPPRQHPSPRNQTPSVSTRKHSCYRPGVSAARPRPARTQQFLKSVADREPAASICAVCCKYIFLCPSWPLARIRRGKRSVSPRNVLTWGQS